MTGAPATSLLNEVGTAGRCCARHRTETLVERDGDRVGERCDLGQRPVRERLASQRHAQSRYTGTPRSWHLMVRASHQLVPGGQHEARLSQGELDAHRGQRPGQGAEVRRGGRSRIVGQALHPQMVQL